MHVKTPVLIAAAEGMACNAIPFNPHFFKTMIDSAAEWSKR
jgi:hypothetical protein